MSEQQRHPVEVLAEEFAARLRQQEQPSIREYIDRYPEHAAAIELAFPSIAMMEQMRTANSPSRLTRLTSTDSQGALRHDSLPEQLGDYKIVAEIGRGGMGVVYHAVQQSLQRPVALKVIRDHGNGNAQRIQRFRREASAVAKLHHTNIVGVYGIGEENGWLFYAMQLIQGTPLQQVIKSLHCSVSMQDEPHGQRPRTNGSLEPAHFVRAAKWLAQVANGLQYAHHLGILHRDIKPSNLMIDADDTIWITDFGVAKNDSHEGLTQTGEIVGTLRYMAPEQLQGRGDARSDIYSAGLTLYELCTLQPALDSSTGSLYENVSKARFLRPRAVRYEVPRDLEMIILKACAAEPEERYQTAQDLEDDLRRFLEDRPILARREPLPTKLRRIARRNPAVAALTVALFLLLICIAGMLAYGNHVKQRSLARIQTEFERAETNLRLKTAALETADSERLRAETNLAMAMEAFAGVIDNISSRGDTDAVWDELEEEGIDRTAADATLTLADIQLLDQLLLFFDRFAIANRTDLSAEVAAATKVVADIQHRLGRLDDSQRSYVAALQTYQALSNQQPTSESLFIPQIEIVSELMTVAAKRGKYGEVLNHFRSIEQLVDAKESTQLSANGKYALAKLYNAMATTGARFSNDNRLRPVRNWSTRMPQSMNLDLVVRPILEERLKRESDANNAARELLTELLATDSSNVNYLVMLARVEREDMRIHQSRGDFPAAQQSLQNAIAILEPLVEQHAESELLQFELANTLRAGTVYAFNDMQRFQRAVRICDQLIQQNPQSIEYRSLRGATLVRIASILHTTGKQERAMETLRRAVEDQEFVAQKFPDVQVYQIAVAQTLSNLADLQLNLGERRAAIQSLEQAIQYASRSVRKGRKFPLLERLRERRQTLVNPPAEEPSDAKPTPADGREPQPATESTQSPAISE
jgi:serine/threonine protein kinase